MPDIKNVRIFKLNYAGTLDEIPEDLLINSFVSISILVIHIPKQKRMYTWIGNKASQSLVNFVPKIRELIVKERPELTTLRTISVDQGKEPDEFFSDITLGRNDFESLIQNQDTKVFSVISDIDQLKIKKSNCIIVGNYKDAIEVSEEIKKLAEEITEFNIIREEEKFISNADRINDLLDEIDRTKPQFDTLVENNKIIEAHEFIEELQEKYTGIIEGLPAPKVKSLLSKHDEVWHTFLEEQDSIERELVSLENTIKISLPHGDIAKATASITRARELLDKSVNDELKQKWEQIKLEYLKEKGIYDISSHAEVALIESDKDLHNLAFDDGISKLDGALEKVGTEELPELTQKLTTKREFLVAKKGEHEKRIILLDVLEKHLEENQQAKKYDVAVKNCKKLIEIAPQLKRDDLVEKYNPLLEKLQQKLEKQIAAKAQEQEELKQKAEELAEVIYVEENTLPIVEDYSAEDLLGDLSSDMDQMIEQVSGLLVKHRVQVRTKVKNTAVLTSAAGEVLELEQTTQVLDIKPEEAGTVAVGATNIVQTSLENPFDDYIEEAVLTDLIPYNFEIAEVHLDGEKVEKLSETTLATDGLEVKWTLQNIPPKHKTEINYNLRRRISRTIVFMLDNQLKFVKTHSNLSKSDLEGLYDVVMPFKNSYEKTLDGVVIEDIIPLYYINSIKEPLDYQPNISSSDKGELIEWKMGSLQTGTYNYHYRLIEIYKFEEIKIKINSLNEQAQNALNEGNLTKAVSHYKEIIELLETYYK